MNLIERNINSDGETVNILSATSELFPLIKTGGLADVTGALPKTLKPFGIHTRTLMPAYLGLVDRCEGVSVVGNMDLFGETASVLSCRKDGLDILLLECPALFHRQGGPYLNENGKDYGDNWKRFAALSLATANIASGCLEGWAPHAVHLHDWQTALAAAYIRATNIDTPVALTIHNLAFQGQFPLSVFPYLQLPEWFCSIDCLEYFGDVCFLKAGIACSEVITTVSPTYAREILTEELGMGMQGVLSNRRDALQGIVNGIDDEIWNPSTDSYIPATYDSKTIGRRRQNRSKIEENSGSSKPTGPSCRL